MTVEINLDPETFDAVALIEKLTAEIEKLTTENEELREQLSGVNQNYNQLTQKLERAAEAYYLSQQNMEVPDDTTD